MMPVYSDGPLFIWWLLFTSVSLIFGVTLRDKALGSVILIYLGGLVAFFVWIVICMVSLMLRSRDEIIGEYRAIRTWIDEGFEFEASHARHLTRDRVARSVIGDVMAQREQYNRIADIARMVLRVLPPVKSFAGEETIGSRCADCPICMEVFKNGELIQSFGLCVHEFHSSCLNSWLQSGKTTCPLCRKDLATSMLARGI